MTDDFIRQFPEYRQIELSQDYFAIVDAENYEWLMQWKWHTAICKNGKVYAVRSDLKANGRARIYMHRFITATPKEMETDYENNNGLMNCRENLRVCTNTQNNRNRSCTKRKTSSVWKGVYWNKARKKWRARIYLNHKLIELGRFASEIEAARAYNAAAIKYHGEFARLNEIPESEAA
jgi:hypothetical protein